MNDAVKITKVLEFKVGVVRKYIQRNFGNLKKEHEITIIQRKEAIKATNYIYIR
ncbi:hypothetical protein [Clostridium sp. ZBS20]|uniref:hypothetical protein n=1 Tax=Clostridium sp. ZBS20 TaxID=2949966 RepID=UPI00207AB1A5|nr:hypothetical protein [Clostridium sp. ZBS20]